MRCTDTRIHNLHVYNNIHDMLCKRTTVHVTTPGAPFQVFIKCVSFKQHKQKIAYYPAVRLVSTVNDVTYPSPVIVHPCGIGV
jgi:hypothetical protein